MTTFFLTDKNGTKHSFNEQQLQALAAQGKIQPTTPLETDTGHKGLAGQIPGLFVAPQQSPKPLVDIDENAFTAMALQKEVDPPSLAQTPIGAHSQEILSHWETEESAGTAVLLFLCDFSFQNMQRFRIANVWYSRIVYAICLILTVATIPIGIVGIQYASGIEDLIWVFLVWGCAFLSLTMTRLIFGLEVIALDWIIETTKAARLYVENNKKGQRK